MTNKAQFQEIRELIQQMGAKTIIMLTKSIQALLANDMDAALFVRQQEKEVDALYLVIEKLCANYIASGEQSEENARFLVAALKISSELERIADYGNNIAKLSQDTFPYLDLSMLTTLLGSFEEMALESASMLKDALKAYEENDEQLALRVLAYDKTVNSLHRKIFKGILALVTVKPWTQEASLYLHTTVRYLERAADRSTNIAQLVFYVKSGKHYAEIKRRATVND
ncbi:MAG: phosphate signaling complex protein PhoU [Sporomusaceae bacterium]|nr:phosphate signaling complex protein PhoU [Sporomusaceae bacterium]